MGSCGGADDRRCGELRGVVAARTIGGAESCGELRAIGLNLLEFIGIYLFLIVQAAVFLRKIYHFA
ncbi:hypothetical protein [Microcoleus sp. D3_18a_C4]|uniref:hypothetical protein n=1 Tax=Microcoleus sp. D3_18a_C4 TaxID=3055332 RepID=UPI002FD450F4